MYLPVSGEAASVALPFSRVHQTNACIIIPLWVFVRAYLCGRVYPSVFERVYLCVYF